MHNITLYLKPLNCPVGNEREKKKGGALVAQAFNPSIWKAEGTRTEATVEYMVRPHFQNKNSKKGYRGRLAMNIARKMHFDVLVVSLRAETSLQLIKCTLWTSSNRRSLETFKATANKKT